jgi:hypothetical protein
LPKVCFSRPGHPVGTVGFQARSQFRKRRIRRATQGAVESVSKKNAAIALSPLVPIDREAAAKGYRNERIARQLPDCLFR